MIRKIKLARINLTMQNGTILRWLKQEGDEVRQDEPLLEVESDKAACIVTSPHTGYLKRILVSEGQEIPVDTVIAYMGDRDDAAPPGVLPGDEIAASDSGERVDEKVAGPGGARRRAGGIVASPLARRLAAEMGVDLAAIRGTGPNGRIGREDVLAAARSEAPDVAGVDSPGRRVPLSRVRKLTAERVSASWKEVPHVSLERKADVTALEGLRDRLNRDAAPGVGRYTVTDMLVHCVSRALAGHRELNATLFGSTVLEHGEVNIGVAVDTPRGLVVTVIRHCDGLDVPAIRRLREAQVHRAREGKQTAEDLSGGTFTITNLGMLGVDSFRPIVNPGQSAILAVGRICQRHQIDATGSVVTRKTARLTLVVDHRVEDGAAAARFLAEVAARLESPHEITAEA